MTGRERRGRELSLNKSRGVAWKVIRWEGGQDWRFVCRHGFRWLGFGFGLANREGGGEKGEFFYDQTTLGQCEKVETEVDFLNFQNGKLESAGAGNCHARPGRVVSLTNLSWGSDFSRNRIAKSRLHGSGLKVDIDE